MLTFIFGGSASGKSEYAEQYAAALAHSLGAPLFYLATLCANDAESSQRIARHRQMRADKPFQTIEAPKEIGGITVPSNSVVLLECLSNLLANQMFSAETNSRAAACLLREIRQLQTRCRHLIVVSNEIFSDGACYDLSTTQYLADLGYLHQALCRTADEIYEVVCGIPNMHRKGEIT